MKWDAAWQGEKFTVTVQWIVDTLKDILAKIFGFIEETEWSEAAE